MVLHDPQALAPDDVTRLRALGIDVVEGPVSRVLGEAGTLRGVEVPGGTVTADAPVVASFPQPLAPPPTPLGLELTALEMMGRVMARSLAADAVGRTAVPRVWAAGNLTDPMSQVVMAAAAGVRTGAMVNAEMVTEDQARRLEQLD